ncbi:MAG: AEC family transporter [Clostridia bacterium]|nr:AEC family transporter [Clostridia bacterium]
MGALETMLRNVIVFVLLAVPGVILVKTKILEGGQSGVLSKVLLYVGMPFLILNSTLDVSFGGDLLKVVLLAAAIGIGYTFLCIFLSKPVTAMEKDEKTRGIMRFCAVFGNNGFLGIPLTMAVFPDRPLVLTFVIIVNIINNAVMYTVGVFMISGDKSTVSVKKALLNPVLIAFIIGLILNLVGVQKYVPEISTYAGYLGSVVTPLSMLILGMKLGGVKLLPMFTSWKTYFVSALKLIVVPTLAVALAFALKGAFAFGEDLVLGSFVAFAMPTAALATTFSDSYGGDVEHAVSFTLGTTILSVVCIPLLYWVVTLLL